MDGTDGLAATQAALVLFFCLFVSDHHAWGFLIIPLLALLGFLPFNWPKARVFMGDVGSGFLGMLLACLILAEGFTEISLWCWIILLTTFWVDATYTLFTKQKDGVRFSHAHKQHLYQKLARRFNSHKTIMFLNAAIVIFWLYPLAYLAYLFPFWGFIFTLTATVPTLVMCLKFEAGKSDS